MLKYTEKVVNTKDLSTKGAVLYGKHCGAYPVSAPEKEKRGLTWKHNT